MFTLETRAGLVAYEEQGAGTPLLLLHASAGDHRQFAAIAPTLAQSYRTIALDWPGFGESAAPDPPQAATAMLMADVLEDVVTQLGLEPAILCGHSVGGFAAARLAIRHPERVRALILVDSGGFSSPSRFFCWLLGRELVARLFAARFARFYLKRRTPLVEQIIAHIDEGRAIPSRAAVDAAIWRSFVHPEHDLRSLATQIAAPTLLIYGRDDPIIRFAQDEGKTCIPHAQRIILETGHIPFAEDPEAFMQAIAPFLHALEGDRGFTGSPNTAAPQ
jgi:pimeloyl-ACP methyl ester carboxylesterase